MRLSQSGGGTSSGERLLGLQGYKFTTYLSVTCDFQVKQLSLAITHGAAPCWLADATKRSANHYITVCGLKNELASTWRKLKAIPCKYLLRVVVVVVGNSNISLSAALLELILSCLPLQIRKDPARPARSACSLVSDG